MRKEPYDKHQLHGDNFTSAEIEEWFRDEERAYASLKHETTEEYAYRAFNHIHSIRYLLKRGAFHTCVALGCADGQDVADLAPVVKRFIGIEPEPQHATQINGTSATFVKPNVSGHIDLPSNSVDLVTSFGVLHHIPNVTFVLKEVSRILESGGLLVVREPNNSMGDSTRPRPGLTPRERGIPADWLKCSLEESGFRLIRLRHCMFRLTYLSKKVVRCPFNSSALSLLDWMASEAFAWNARYHRETWFAKAFAPTSTYIIAEKLSAKN